MRPPATTGMDRESYYKRHPADRDNDDPAHLRRQADAKAAAGRGKDRGQDYTSPSPRSRSSSRWSLFDRLSPSSRRSRHSEKQERQKPKTAVAESRFDEDYDEESSDLTSLEEANSKLDLPSPTHPPPTEKLYLPKTLRSLTSLLTHDSEEVNQATAKSPPPTWESGFIFSLFGGSTYDSETLSPTSTGRSPVSTGRSPVSVGLSPHSAGSRTFFSHADNGVYQPSPKHREKLMQWYHAQRARSPRQPDDAATLDETVLSGDTFTAVGTYASFNSEEDGESLRRQRGDLLEDAEGDYLRTKQPVAYLSIGLTVVQLLILMIQLAMCGIAPIEINPLVGPYPDAFSEFGGKNTYLMVSQDQWWRLLTPSLLHVGILHLLINAFCQLETVSLFEREWGSFRWLIVYLVSSVGASGMASIFDPDTIAVGSSGALMGLYAAKLAQVTTGLLFDVSKRHMNNAIRLDQLSSVLCGLTLVSVLSCVSFIDWSGHFGGLVAGFLSGVVLFSNPIRSCLAWGLWVLLGLAALAGTFAGVFRYLLREYVPLEELGDVCEYFQSLFAEDYECGCMNR